ncbi:hypothetical protein [Neorhizobium sp. DT-125]|uniref:hypothetical protein n=1 Tax=Neorhizobium sp. DT-125 TaxID=3396163 RepID=UPI003F1CE7C5
MNLDFVPLLVIHRFDIFSPEDGRFRGFVFPSARADDVVIDLGAALAAQPQIFLGQLQ